MRVRENMTPEQERQLELVTAATYALAVLRDPDASTVMRKLVANRLDIALQMCYKDRTRDSRTSNPGT